MRQSFRPLPISQADEEGFTLVQLMVVVGLVAVLMALLFGAAGRITQSARTVKCAKHLKQWGTLFAVYQTENNGAFPLIQPNGDGLSWNGLTAPLLKSLANAVNGNDWRKGASFNGCPEHLGDRISPSSEITKRYYSYVYNVRLGNPAFGSTYRGSITALANPAQTIVLADGTDAQNLILFYDPSYMGFLHGGQCNLLFADGHVERRFSIPEVLYNPALTR